MRTQREVLLTVNSPGEVATWLAPTVAALRTEDGSLRLSVFILPCTYAAGTEAEVVQAIPGVDVVVPPGESLRYALWGRLPRGWRPVGRGVVAYLGGEYFLAARLARQAGYSATAYTAGYINTVGAFARVFVPREDGRAAVIQRGVPEGKVHVVGDLMVDAACSTPPRVNRAGALDLLGLERARPVVALFPGSRPHEFKRVMGLFIRAAAILQSVRPSLQFALAVSPFTSREALESGLAEAAGDGSVGRERGVGVEVLGGGADFDSLFRTRGNRVQDRVRTSFRVDSCELPVTFFRGSSHVVMAAADLALTIPGSNTAEMGAWGLPMVVCVPMDRPDEIPIEGLFGLVGRVPVVGRRIKVAAVRRMANRTRFVALPNRAAGRDLVPELRSETLSPQDVADEGLKLLTDDALRARMSRELVEAMGPPGAAERIAGHVRSILERDDV